ncbi:MAG: EipB family protein [Bacteroidota bacterium]
MRRFTAGLLTALASAVAVACPVSAAPAGEALAAHRAVYALSLGDLRSSSAVTDAAGRFEFAWTDVCDGWAVTQRFRLALLYEDDLSISFGWSLSSWESKDGRQYRFFIRRFDGAGELEQVRGEATLADNGSGRAVYYEPEPREVALPPGTLFPTAHTRHVLAETARGAAPVWTQVFDGSGEGGPFGVSAILSRALPPEAPARIDSPLLTGIASWRVSLAYYGIEAGELEPEQEQDLRLFANGVVDEMRLDYGDFVLDASLAELESLPRPDC